MELNVMQPDQLEDLIQGISLADYQVIGPIESNGVIAYEPIESADDLPIGIIDHQSPGKYALQKVQSSRFFGYTFSPFSWKKYLYPPVQTLFKAGRNEQGIQLETDSHDVKYAFIGVRACELSAIKIQDKIFLGGEYVDLHYKQRRENALIVAVECFNTCETCFCDSVGSGPDIPNGADIVLTEILESGEHYFLVRSETEAGQTILNQINLKDTENNHHLMKDAQLERVRAKLKRKVQTTGLKSKLLKNSDHPRWDEVAERCLACSNCTMVCPTCFCSDVFDINDLDGNTQRERRWDSCFTSDFTYIHGGNVRHSVKSRYRQWLTHKFASWQDQFDSLGCVGCGRCISWCPAGIDITEELAELSKKPTKHEKGETIHV